MKALREALLATFGPQQVVRVEYVTAFSEPFPFWVWLGTTTDVERDELARDSSAGGRVAEVAGRFGFDALCEGFTVESQETVDRDYAGNWFYRLR